MDLTILLPQIAFNLIIFLLFLLYLKYNYFPSWINELIEVVPINFAPAPQVYKLHLKAINDRGLVIQVCCLLPKSKLPLSFLKTTVRITSITIKEFYTNDLVGVLYLQGPLVFDDKKDLIFDQLLRLDFSESVPGLKSLIKRISVVGMKEISRISVKVEFNLTFSVNNLFVMERIPCSKTINLGDLVDTLEQSHESIVSETSILDEASISTSTSHETQTLHENSITTSPKPSRLSKVINHIQETHLHHLQDPMIKDHLLPPHEITPFSHPGLRGIEAGLEIAFSRPPQLNFNFGKIVTSPT